MSYKYIPQINNQNFVYPNGYLAEYDVDLVQDINENYVTGTTSSFAATGTTSTGMTITFNYTWAKNSADVFISNGTLKVLSLHMLAAGQNYYKPWRLVGALTTDSTTSEFLSGIATYVVTPAMLGLSTFITGTYYFEVRMIGTKAIYPICQTLSITI